MAKRKFELPGIHDLSKEQEDARALPMKGQHLIIGGPGTGKSILALLRCRRHAADKDQYAFLVYNHLLHETSRHLFGKEIVSYTWMSWFRETFRNLTNADIPLLPRQPGNNYLPYDWPGILKVAQAIPGSGQSPHSVLVIDEGQDMPPEFYQTLTHLGFENFFVVADQNQQIVTEQNSSRQDIEIALGIDTVDVVELSLNYRNSYHVARLAREFYTGDPASPPPKLPPKPKPPSEKTSGSAETSVLIEYGAEGAVTFQKIITKILMHADRNPSKLLGVITPNNKVRELYVAKLKILAGVLKFDNVYPKIQTFVAGGRPACTFADGGIMVINAQSCKGLEFDSVYLADIDQFIFNPRNPDHVVAKKRLFYVMVARARENVIMLKQPGRCPVDSILPNDPDILERI